LKEKVEDSFRSDTYVNLSIMIKKVPIDLLREKNIPKGTNERNITLGIIMTTTNDQKNNREGVKPREGLTLH